MANCLVSHLHWPVWRRTPKNTSTVTAESPTQRLEGLLSRRFTRRRMRIQLVFTAGLASGVTANHDGDTHWFSYRRPWFMSREKCEEIFSVGFDLAYRGLTRLSVAEHLENMAEYVERRGRVDWPGVADV